MSSATTHPAVTPSEKYYKIVTSDEKVFNVPECKINRMTTIRNMIDDVEDDPLESCRSCPDQYSERDIFFFLY